MIEIITSFLILVGCAFALIGSIGLARLPDFHTRLHGPTKATTLGVGALLLGSIVFFTAKSGSPQLAELLIALFLTLTAPVSAYMLARASANRVEEVVGDNAMDDQASPPD